MRKFLYEDEITKLFRDYLKKQGWVIESTAKGRKRGADIVAKRSGKRIYIEAKGGGSQDPKSKRFGSAFTKLQSQQNTDVAFACLARMISRYCPDYIGMVLHHDAYHHDSVKEILPTIKKIQAGVWLVSKKGVVCLAKPKQQK